MHIITHVDMHNIYIYNFVATETDSHEPVTESSSEESDEEMVVQDWRRNRYLRETYLDSIRVILTYVHTFNVYIVCIML